MVDVGDDAEVANTRLVAHKVFGRAPHCIGFPSAAIVPPFLTPERSLPHVANIKSQIKRNRQNERLRVRNKAARSELKTRARAAIIAAESGDADAAESALRLAQQRIDNAIANGVLPKNTGARRKSRLTKQVHSLLA